MVTYEEALKKAKQIKPNINNGAEMTSAFIFGYDSGEWEEGGNNTPVVILKDSGKAITMPYYNAHYTKDKEIKVFKKL